MKKRIFLFLAINLFISKVYSQYIKSGEYKAFEFTADTNKVDSKVFSNECDTTFNELKFPENLPLGKWIGYYIGGKMKACELIYKNHRVASVKTFYINGNIKEIYTLTDGYINGKYQSFYKNQKIESEIYYNKGKELLGKSKIWSEDGKEQNCNDYRKFR